MVIRFHIIHTNDLHSHFERWPQTVSVIKRLKASLDAAQEAYILVDLGDHMDRANFITEGSQGKANVELMNYVGYDYATLGNNEGITFSKQELDNLYTDASFSILLNNLYEPDGSRPSWLVPYAIHQVDQWKIGLIGTTVDFIPFYQSLGWKMENALESIEKDVHYLRDKVDFLILLSHLGLPRDEELVERLEGIDLIIGAHTHHLLPEGKYLGNTLITQAGRFGDYVGHITVEYTREKTYHLTAQVYPTMDEPADEGTLELLAKWEKRAEKSLAQPVTVLTEELHDTWFEESVIGNLLAEGLKEWCQSSIALVNSGVILDHLVRGTVTRRDIHRICPHPINPCLITLKGMEIWSILERSLSEEIQRKEIRGFGFRGKVVGMLSLDGLEVSVYTLNNREKRIKEIMVNGAPIDHRKEYAVATLDMFTFQKLFPELYQPKEVKFFLPEFIRDVLQFRLEQGNLERAKQKRWKCLS